MDEAAAFAPPKTHKVCAPCLPSGLPTVSTKNSTQKVMKGLWKKEENRKQRFVLGNHKRCSLLALELTILSHFSLGHLLHHAISNPSIYHAL